MKKIAFLLIFLTLFSCDRFNPRCVDASDFGQPIGSPGVGGNDVNPRFGQASEYDYFDKTKSDYTGFILTGDELIVRIKGAWSPWSSEIVAMGETCGRVDKVCSLSSDFTAMSFDGWDGHRFHANETCSDNLPKSNICWFPYGLGIYLGFSNDPSIGLEILHHLVDPTYYALENGNWKFKLPESEIDNIRQAIGVDKFSSVRIYLRAHDNSYIDNVNGCIVDDTNGKPKLNPVDGDIYECATPMELSLIHI